MSENNNNNIKDKIEDTNKLPSNKIIVEAIESVDVENINSEPIKITDYKLDENNNINNSSINTSDFNNNINNNINASDFNNNNINNNKSAEQMEAELRAEKRAEFLEQKKQKRKKTFNLIGKSVRFASCVLIFGAGVGVGSTISKNIVIENEKENFKFDISNLKDEFNGELILTSGSASNIFKNAGDSVVNISTQTTHGVFFTQTSEGSGSGIIYKIEDDIVYIITNNHVIEDAQYVTISVTGEEQISGKLVGTDATSDLAVFSVSKQDMINAGIENISVAEFANSDYVEVGDFVYPIGNALGEGKTMTQGMISAHNKEINIDGNNLTVLQTDAAINPGNSGGALIDSSGLVVGINTAKLASSQIEGIGYAIPSNIAVEICDQIIENGSVQRPYFGVVAKTITASTKEIYGIKYDGVLISEVEAGSNAEKSGLIPTDIIISFDNKEILNAEDLSNAIKNAKINETFEFEIIRNGIEHLKLNVTMALPNQGLELQEFIQENNPEEGTQEQIQDSIQEEVIPNLDNNLDNNLNNNLEDIPNNETYENHNENIDNLDIIEDIIGGVVEDIIGSIAGDIIENNTDIDIEPIPETTPETQIQEFNN